MAKGLIKRSTLTAIADAIRAKTGSADTILPADMAAMIEGIIAGGAIAGTFIVASSAAGAAHSLGRSLPEYADYCFIFAGMTRSCKYPFCVILYVDGEYKRAVINDGESNYTAQNVVIDFANGTISRPNMYPDVGEEYIWFYLEVEGGTVA